MTLEESKISLKTNGYCDFDLKEFSSEYYNLIEKVRYKIEDTKYLEKFKVIRFDYHSEEDNNHINYREVLKSFTEANLKKEELLKKYDYENCSQFWLQSENVPMHTDPEFANIFFDILKYFYNETKNDVNISQQWTCYSEKCFLKDHNDGQGSEYQNTCAILIYLNEEWDEAWGGNLILRNTKSTYSNIVAHKVVPTFGKVAIIDLKIFDTSHAVESVIGDHNRCTLISFATSKISIVKLDKTYF